MPRDPAHYVLYVLSQVLFGDCSRHRDQIVILLLYPHIGKGGGVGPSCFILIGRSPRLSENTWNIYSSVLCVCLCCTGFSFLWPCPGQTCGVVFRVARCYNFLKSRFGFWAKKVMELLSREGPEKRCVRPCRSTCMRPTNPDLPRPCIVNFCSDLLREVCISNRNNQCHNVLSS